MKQELNKSTRHSRAISPHIRSATQLVRDKLQELRGVKKPFQTQVRECDQNMKEICSELPRDAHVLAMLSKPSPTALRCNPKGAVDLSCSQQTNVIPSIFSKTFEKYLAGTRSFFYTTNSGATVLGTSINTGLL
eukprot:5539616-Amphidinium_carterae.1